MKRFLALFLILALVLGVLSACGRDQELFYDLPATEDTSSTETTGETTPEYENIIPPLDEDADVLTFRYEEQYLDLFYEKLDEYKEHALNDSTMDEIELLDPQLEELLQFLSDQQAIAMVLYYCDMEDEEASELYLDMTDMITEVQEKTIETMREIYKSDSALKDEIFEDYTEEDIQSMMDYDPEIKDIEMRNSEIVVEFQAMDDDELETDIGPLYAELVANYNRQAEIYGYDNYYDYAYDRVYFRDYSAKEVEQMRAYAKQYLVPALNKATEGFPVKLDELSTREFERLQAYVIDDYDETDYLEAYFDQLPDDVRQDMESMFDGNVIFPKSRNAMPGAFTTVINYHPFCFFSRNNKTVSTVVHEMGHYYGALYGDMDAMPLDLAEVQSQANEWLMVSCMDGELKGDDYECYLDFRMIDDMGTILISLIIDEFEQRVYSSEGVENFTTEDFDRIMDEVCQEYGGREAIEANLTDLDYYWRRVALEHPVYYISYAVSLIPSMDVFFVASEDWEKGLEIYLGLTRDITEEPTFLGALEEAGLASPFDDKVYAAIGERYQVVEEG